VSNILPVSSPGLRHRAVLQAASSVWTEPSTFIFEVVHYPNCASQDVQITYFKNCRSSVRSNINGYQYLLMAQIEKQIHFAKYVIFGITDDGQVHNARVLTEP